MDVQTLADILALTPNGLVLNQATVAVGPQRATISSPAQVLGRPGFVSLVITPGTDGLQSSATAGLSNLTLDHMSALGWLDPALDISRVAAMSFATVNISAGDQAGDVVVVAPLTANQVLAARPLALAQAQLELRLISSNGAVVPVSAAITARAGADALGVSLTIPTPYTGWTLATDPGVSRSFAALGSDLDAFLGIEVSGILPAGLPGGFGLSDLTCEFSPETASLLSFAVTAGTTQPWAIISGALELNSAAVTVEGRHYPAYLEPDAGWTFAGSIAASFDLFGVPVDIDADLGLTTLTFSATPMLTFPGVGAAAGQISALLGGGDFSPVLPSALTNFAAVVVETLTVQVDTTGPTIDGAALTLSKPEDLDWTFPFLPGLSVVDARTTLAVVKPLDAANRSISGLVSITAEIGSAEAEFSIVRQPGASMCAISLTTSDGIALPDLLGVVGLDQTGFSAALPSSLSIVSDFGLTQLDVTYDLDASLASEIYLTLELGDSWKVIPGALEMTELTLALSIGRPDADPANRTVAGSLAGAVEIGGVDFGFLAATSNDPTDGWRLRVAMADGASVSLTDLAGAILPSGLTLPDQFPVISLDGAGFDMATATLKTSAWLSTSVSWSPTVMGKAANMANLSLGLEVQPAAQDGTRPYVLTVAGALSLESLPTLSAVCRTGNGVTDTEILAVIAPADLSTLSPDSVATEFGGQGASLSGAPVPSGFSSPAFTSAALYVNITNPGLVLFGQANRLGSAALVISRLAEASTSAPAQYGAALILSTAPGFRFADIVADDSTAKPVLAAIDGVLTVEHASLTLSSFDLPAGAANPFAAMNRLGAAAVGLPTPVIVPPVPTPGPVKAGLNLDARLTLSTDSFWQGFKYIIETRGDSAILLHAWFDPANPGQTRFEADLGTFTILQTLTFDQVHLVYVPNAGVRAAPAGSSTPPPATTAPTLTLNCSGSLPIPTFAAASQANQPDDADTTLLTFTGDLTVTGSGAAATFTAQTGATLRHPLGIPGITVNSVGIGLNYVFAASGATTTPTLTRLAAEGSVTLGPAALTGAVLFVSGVPQIVLVTLDQPLTLNDIFNQCIGTDAFSGLPALGFQAGFLYYAKVEVPAAGDQPEYKQGFHLRTTTLPITALFDTAFVLTIDIIENDGVTGAAYTQNPLDFGFVTITGPEGPSSDPNTPATGPGLSIQALKSTGAKVFALQFGFELFGLTFNHGLLSYQTDTASSEATYTGSIAYSGSTPFGDNPSLTVQWTKSGGFKVLNWPGALPIADLTRLFEAVSAGSPCGALTALGMADNFVQGQCKTDINVSAGTPQHNQDGTTTPVAHVEIDLRYLVSLPNPKGGARIVLNANVAPVKINFDVVAPKDTSIATLLQKAVEAAADAVAGVVQSILDDPEAMIAFVGALALKKLTTEAINNLICRDIDDPDLKDEYEERNQNEEDGDGGDEADNQLEKATESAAEAAAATTVEGAMTAANAVVAAGAIMLGFLSALIDAVYHLIGQKSPEEKRRDAMQDKLNEQQQKADDAVRSHLVVNQLTVAYQGSGVIVATWSAVHGDVAYVPTLIVNGAVLYPHEGIPGMGQRGTTATFQNAALGPGVQVSVSVYSTISSGDIINTRTWNGATATASVTVDDFGPHRLLAELVDGAIAVSWTPGPQAATGWVVSASVPGDQTAAPITATLPASAVSWSPASFTPGKTYDIRVQPQGATYPDIAPGAVLPTTAVPAPTGLAAVYDATGVTLTATWAPASGALSVRVQAKAPSVAEQAAGPTDQSTVFRNASALANCLLRVGAVGPPASAGEPAPVDWSPWLTFAPAIPAAPVISGLTYRPPMVVAAWAALAGDPAYDAQLLDGAMPTQNLLVGTVAGLQAAFAGTFSAGATVTAQARGRSPEAAGPWSAPGAAGSPNQLTLVDIATPAGLSAINGDDKVHLSWSPVAAAGDGYEILVRDASGALLQPQPGQTAGPGGATTADLDGSVMDDGSSYTIEVRARAGRSFSPPAGVTLVRAPEHPGKFLSLQNTLAAPTEGGPLSDATLTATVLGPVAAPPLSVGPGETTPLGLARVSRAEVVHVTTTRPDGLTGLIKAGIAVLDLGGRLTIAWDKLEGGTAASGTNVVVLRGFRLASGEIWSDAPPAAMAEALSPLLATRDLLANALLDVYPDLGYPGLAGVLADLGDTPSQVARTLVAQKRLGGAGSDRLAALTEAFKGGGALRPSPFALIAAATGVEADQSPASVAAMVAGAYAQSIGPSYSGIMAALSLDLRGVSQTDALTALGSVVVAPVTAADCVTPVYGDARARTGAVLSVLRLIGFPLQLALSIATSIGSPTEPTDLAAAIRQGYPDYQDVFVLLKILSGANGAPQSSDLATGAAALATIAQPDPAVLAIAMRALTPSPSETQPLAVGLAAGEDLGILAKALRDAYQPTTLQLAALLNLRGGAGQPAQLAQALAAAGAPPGEVTNVLAEFFPLLTADERAAFAGARS